MNLEERATKTFDTLTELILGLDVTPPTEEEIAEMNDYIAKFPAPIYKKDIETLGNPWMNAIKEASPLED